MEFITLPCHEALRPFIRNYWLLTAYCTARGTQQVFSNGAASLHFYFSQNAIIDGDNKPAHTVFNHPDLGCMKLITEEGPLVIFGVEFVPFCSHMFFRTKSNDAHLTPSEMQDDEFEEVSRKIHAADSTETRSKLLDAFFIKRLSDIPVDEVNLTRLNDVFNEIMPTDGTKPSPPNSQEEFSPADLAATAHLGQKQFTRVFNKYVGINPKSYLRLLRFHKALMELQKSKDEELLTETAWRCGYYDLSHMTSDFRALCGYSPSELLSAKSALTEVFQTDFSGLMRKKIKIENLI